MTAGIKIGVSKNWKRWKFGKRQILCSELSYIPKELFESLEQDGEKLIKLINGYIGYLKRSKQGHNEPGSKRVVDEGAVKYGIDISADN